MLSRIPSRTLDQDKSDHTRLRDGTVAQGRSAIDSLQLLFKPIKMVYVKTKSVYNKVD